LLSVGKHEVALAPAAKKLVAVSLANGKGLWSMEYSQGRYNAATPVIDGSKAYIAGPNRGITALEFSDEGDTISSKEIWRNEDTETTALYNSPVLVDGMLFGLSTANQLFCVSAENGKMEWNSVLPGAAADAASPQRQGRPQRPQRGTPPTGGGDAERGGGNPPGGGNAPQRGGRQRGGFGGRGGQGGYGSVVATGSALVGLTPASQLFVYEPNGSEYKELARYKVAETPTYAYPLLSGNRIYIRDKDSLTMWTVGD
jgi:hypothetical protein